MSRSSGATRHAVRTHRLIETMPHITVEVPGVLSSRIDWQKCFSDLHASLADQGFARLEDFKSRVIVLDEWLVADKDSSAGFIFATLQTMNPRPAEMLRSMAKAIHGRLEQEALAVAGHSWVQCCVRIQTTAPEDYFKSHINPPALKEGNFKVGEK